MVCWGKFYRSKIIGGGGGGATSALPLKKNRCVLKDGTLRLVIFLSQIESSKDLFIFVATQFKQCVWRDVYLGGYK